MSEFVVVGWLRWISQLHKSRLRLDQSKRERIQIVYILTTTHQKKLQRNSRNVALVHFYLLPFVYLLHRASDSENTVLIEPFKFKKSER